MSEVRRFPTEDITYREWHRTASISRFIPVPEARHMKMIDIDAVVLCEYDAAASKPVALIETVKGAAPADGKPCTVTRRLAEMAGIAAYCVVYQPANVINRSLGPGSKILDIQRFWVRQLTPSPSALWTEMAPQQFAEFVRGLRQCAVLDRP